MKRTCSRCYLFDAGIEQKVRFRAQSAARNVAACGGSNAKCRGILLFLHKAIYFMVSNGAIIVLILEILLGACDPRCNGVTTLLDYSVGRVASRA